MLARSPLVVVAFLLPSCLSGPSGPSGLAAAPSLVMQKELVLSGYATSLRGETIEYNSAEPDVNRALLVRSLERKRSIAWRSEVLPEHPAKGSEEQAAPSTLCLYFLFGINARAETRHFDLYLDGRHAFRFQNPKNSELRRWQAEAKGPGSLDFRVTYVDRHLDSFGYARLRLPRELVTPGKSLDFEVRGESANSPIWFMCFESPARSRVALQPLPALLRSDSGPQHAVRLGIVHLGAAARARVDVPGDADTELRLDFGWNEQLLRLPPVQEPTKTELHIEIEGQRRKHELHQHPVRPWHIDLVQHSHTDIGYTRPQSEILPEHLRFIDDALDYCDATDSWPDAARFRWTCEANWPVREYLRTRPSEQIDRLRRRVREGRIELTGLMFNMAELPSDALLTAFLAPISELQDAGLPVRSAMQNDVNGAAWCLAEYLPQLGVRYLSMGEHGHRARIPFDVPTPFWWEAPSGRRVLAWRAEHYMTGNFWGLHTGELRTVERELFRYLDGLSARGYPMDRLSIQYSGYMTDNSPPSLIAPRLIRQWNERYAWPQLRSAVASDFLQWVEAEHGEDLPTHRVAWPDWWTDGFGSALRETAIARRTQHELRATESLFAIATLLGSERPADYEARVESITDSLLFYFEHTFGADESILRPFGNNNMVQWGEKAAYAWTARKETRILQEIGMGLLRPHLPASELPLLVAVNTLGHTRTGQCELWIDHELLPPDATPRIVDEQGRAVLAQRIQSRSDVSLWRLRVPELPSMGFRCFKIQAGEPKSAKPNPVQVEEALLENEFYRIEVDAAHGTIRSIYDKEWQRELVDPEGEWGFGTLVHERLGNRHQLEAFRLDEFTREAMQVESVTAHQHGTLWRSLLIRARSQTATDEGGVQIELRLHEHDKCIELIYRLDKKLCTDPESAYVAFPFQLPGAQLSYRAQGGLAIPGKNLLPRTASDWQSVQSYACVTGSEGSILLHSPDAHLMQFGGIQTGRFEDVAIIEKAHIYSWPFNNYWTTNFQASQHGELIWHYRIRSGGTNATLPGAERWGRAESTPILARVVPPSQSRRGSMQRSLLSLRSASLGLSAARPLEDGVLLQVRNDEAEAQPLQLQLSDGIELGPRSDPLGRASKAPLDEAIRGQAYRFVELRRSGR
jgi:alpha-mannosidase